MKPPTVFHLPSEIHIDLRVTGIREMRFRFWIGGKLIRLAAWLLGGEGSVEAKWDVKPQEKALSGMRSLAVWLRSVHLDSQADDLDAYCDDLEQV